MNSNSNPGVLAKNVVPLVAGRTPKEVTLGDESSYPLGIVKTLSNRITMMKTTDWNIIGHMLAILVTVLGHHVKMRRFKNLLL